MKIFYFTPADILVPRVERTCLMHFCGALARAGVDVEVISLNIKLKYKEPTSHKDIWSVYGLEPNFKVRMLPTLLTQNSPDPLGTIHRFFSYSYYSFYRFVLKRTMAYNKRVIFYFRNYALGLPFLILKKIYKDKLFLLFEVHTPPTNKFKISILKHMDGIVTINNILTKELPAYEISPHKIITGHQGVDLDYIEQKRLPVNEARKILRLPQNRKIVAYTGKVYRGYREIELFLEAAKYLPQDILMLIVGGRQDHVIYYREKIAQANINNVVFTGFVPPSEVFNYQSAADALLIYYPKGMHLNAHRSPGKLFEYMASKNPIISADYPAIRDVLDDNSALFVESDNPRALAKAIMKVLSDKDLAARLAENAYKKVKEYTWDKRAEKILEFISKKQ